MALLFMDGFDAGDLTQKWDLPTGGGNFSVMGTTRFSTGRSAGTNFGVRGNLKAVPASAQLFFGGAIFANDSGSNLWVDFFADGGTVTHIRVGFNLSANGRVTIHRGAGSTLLATSATSYAISAWHYLEAAVTVDDAAGTVVVKLDGVQVLSFTGDTRNGGTSTNMDAFSINGSSSNNVLFDDVYLLNNTGTTNNTFLGDSRIHTLVPTGDGASSALTGSDGNQVANWQQVDELPFSSTDYNGSPNTGDRDTYAMADLPGSVTTVYGVQNNIVAGKSDANNAFAKSVLRLSATNYYGTTHPLLTTYWDYFDTYDKNPNTTAAWTVSDVNGMESGMEVA